ncbi:MAG: type II secretion system protein N [Sphingomonas sp.]
MRLNTIVRRDSAIRIARQVSIVRAAEVVLLAALAVQAARLVWTVATPVNPMGAWQLNEPGIDNGAADILGSIDPFFRLDPAPQEGPATAVTPLQLGLFGIRLDSATGRGSAIIATPDGLQKAYSVGDEILPGLTLKAVAFDHVTLNRGGAEEALFIDQSGGDKQGALTTPAPAPGTEPLPPSQSSSSERAPGAGKGVTREEIQRDIGFIPRIDGGKVTGLTVRPQGTSDAFFRVGLQEGDVVTQIGGRPVTGAQDLERLVSSLANGGSVSLSVERGAQVVPIAVTVKSQ